MRRLAVFIVAVAACVCCVTAAAVRADSDTGGVSGYVQVRHFQDGRITPVDDATVIVSGAAGEWQVQTGSDGFFVLFGVPPGLYMVSARDEHKYYLQPPVSSGHHVCLHAGEQRSISLMLIDPGYANIDWWGSHAWGDYMAQIRPDSSQTADVYSLGDC